MYACIIKIQVPHEVESQRAISIMKYCQDVINQNEQM